MDTVTSISIICRTPIEVKRLFESTKQHSEFDEPIDEFVCYKLHSSLGCCESWEYMWLRITEEGDTVRATISGCNAKNVKRLYKWIVKRMTKTEKEWYNLKHPDYADE